MKKELLNLLLIFGVSVNTLLCMQVSAPQVLDDPVYQTFYNENLDSILVQLSGTHLQNRTVIQFFANRCNPTRFYRRVCKIGPLNTDILDLEYESFPQYNFELLREFNAKCDEINQRTR